MSKSRATVLIILTAILTLAYLQVAALGQENGVNPAQEVAAPQMWSWERVSEKAWGYGCLAVVLLFYTAVPYVMIFKSRESNNPNAFFGMGLILGTPVIAVLFGGLGYGIGYLIGLLFGDGPYGGNVGFILCAGVTFVTFSIGVLYFLAGICGWTGDD